MKAKLKKMVNDNIDTDEASRKTSQATPQATPRGPRFDVEDEEERSKEEKKKYGQMELTKTQVLATTYIRGGEEQNKTYYPYESALVQEFLLLLVHHFNLQQISRKFKIYCIGV